MKTKIIRLLALVMALCMVFTVAACNSGGNDGSSAVGSGNDISSSVEESSGDSGDLPAGGKYATVEDFVNSDIMQDQITTLKDSLGDTMDIEIYAEGSTLVYAYTYPEGTDTTGLGDALLSSLESQASTFGTVASSITAAVDVTDPTVKVIYLDAEGNEIASRTFSEADAG